VTQRSDSSLDPTRIIAQRFVAARLAATPLDRYPAPLPPDIDSAYLCQDAAIALWPDEIVGWKVGWIGEPQQRIYHEERIVGPIFRRALRQVQLDEEAPVSIFAGGFGAIEAE
jgi:2-keto-4-pentenoate hydratase